MVPDELLRGPTEQRFTKETHGSLFSSLILAEGMMACPFCDWLGWLYVFSESLDPSQGREGNRELSTQWWSCLGCCPKCWQIKHVKTAKTYLGPEPHSVNPPCKPSLQGSGSCLHSCNTSWAILLRNALYRTLRLLASVSGTQPVPSQDGTSWELPWYHFQVTPTLVSHTTNGA